MVRERRSASRRKQQATKKVSRATLRPYILLTLSHAEAEKRKCVIPKVIIERLTEVLTCSAIIVAKEKHQGDGFHFHIAIENKDASRNTVTRLLRETFPEFEGAQTSVKFHKSWGTLSAYVTKEDKKPTLWGRYNMEQIREQAYIARAHRRASQQNKEQQVDKIYNRLKESKQWLDVYKDPILREANIKRYQNIKMIFQDLKTIEQIERDPLQALSLYLKEKGDPQEYDIEDLKEKYLALDWIAINLAFPRSLKAKQLCIQGRPSSQKSLIFKLISEVITTYFAGTRINDFTDAHDFFDLWVLDEFKEPVKDSFTNALTEEGQGYINTLLRILDGQEVKLDAKYQAVFTKRNNVPIICATNQLGTELSRAGPLNERFIFTVFNTRIQDLQTERIIATLYGCILRRVEQRCKIAGYSPEEQKRILDSPENIVKIMRENKSEIRYNELEVKVPEEETERNKGVFHLVFRPQTDKKQRVYAKIEGRICKRITKFNPDEKNIEIQETMGKLQVNALYIKRDATLNKKKVELLEVAKIPLKKTKFTKVKVKEEEGQKDPENIHAYYMTKDDQLLVYRRKSRKEEDYAAWPITLEIQERDGSTSTLSANLRIRSNKEERGVKKKEEEEQKKYEEDSPERKEAFLTAKLKLGIETKNIW